MDAFADEDLKARVLQAYKGAVGWRVQRTHDNVHTNERRKVCPRIAVDNIVRLKHFSFQHLSVEHAVER